MPVRHMVVALRRGPLARARHILPFLALGATLPAVAEHVASADAASVGQALTAVPVGALVLALAATALSFAAVGRFDGAVHRWLGTGVEAASAARVGAASVAVSQTLGFGLVTGALSRWRGLPGLALLDTARVTGAVTGAFMAALMVIVVLAALLVGLPDGAPGWVVAPGVAVIVLLPLLSLLPHRHAGLLPPLALLGPLLAIAAADVTAAGIAFWLLLPSEPAFAASAVLPAFLLALAAGLLSGTPGGVGPFEITLLALLPDAPQAELLAAILGFRVICYALPAVLGAAWLALRCDEAVPARVPALSAGALASARRAEAGLVRLGELRPLGAPGATFVGAVTAQAVVAVGDPLAETTPAHALAALAAAAAERGRRPLIYKAGARLAAGARSAGWAVVPVAEEAWLDPAAFRVDTPARRRLRRKLRAAGAAGVEVALAEGPLPMGDLAAIAAEWARARGGERGFSMGRFAPDYVAGQRVYVARCGGRPVAFVTFHEAAREWTLDLVRTLPDAPDGATYALLAAAIEDAARAGVLRLSLAAVRPEGRWPAAADRLARRLSGEGLRRFKAAFAPRWETLYAAAPDRLSLALGLWDVAWRIHRPLPLPVPPMQDAQDRHENYRVAAA